MKSPSSPEYDPQDLIVECSFTIRTGNHRELGKFADTVVLPTALHPHSLESASGQMLWMLKTSPLRRIESIINQEVKALLPAIVVRRIDRTHPDWVLKSNLEDEEPFHALFDHARREMEIAEED